MNKQSTAEKRSYDKLIKILQIATGVLLVGFTVAGIILINKYDIKVSNIKNLSEYLTGGAMTVAFIIIGVSVLKSFMLVFPPAVIFSVCGYVMPNFAAAFTVNLISVVLSLCVPYFLGKFTGANMVDTLKKKFKAVKKIDDFAGANETKLTAVVKFAGIMPGDLSGLLFGAMDIGFSHYMLGSIIGNLPLVAVYTFFGIVLKNVGEKPWVAAIPVAVIILFLGIAALITKKMIKDGSGNQTDPGKE